MKILIFIDIFYFCEFEDKMAHGGCYGYSILYIYIYLVGIDCTV